MTLLSLVPGQCPHIHLVKSIIIEPIRGTTGSSGCTNGLGRCKQAEEIDIARGLLSQNLAIRYLNNKWYNVLTHYQFRYTLFCQYNHFLVRQNEER